MSSSCPESSTHRASRAESCPRAWAAFPAALRSIRSRVVALTREPVPSTSGTHRSSSATAVRASAAAVRSPSSVFPASVRCGRPPPRVKTSSARSSRSRPGPASGRFSLSGPPSAGGAFAARAGLAAAGSAITTRDAATSREAAWSSSPAPMFNCSRIEFGPTPAEIGGSAGVGPNPELEGHTKSSPANEEGKSFTCMHSVGEG